MGVNQGPNQLLQQEPCQFEQGWDKMKEAYQTSQILKELRIIWFQTCTIL